MLASTSPLTWAEIAERLGIPFAILLFLMFALVIAAAWSAKHVVKPLVNSHVALNAKLSDTLLTVREEEKAQTGQLTEIRGEVKEVKADVQQVSQHVRQVKGMVSQIARNNRAEGENGVTAPN